uniref:Large ribosomal subunit protein mL62 n=1 Tax=Acrobeloides nanus TaxID=290746 RepID=A0A914D738_9BILA
MKRLVPNTTSFGLIQSLRIFSSNASTSGSGGKLFDGNIPEDKFKKNYVRSSGPGGQFVNKRNTKAVIKFNKNELDWLHPVIKEKFLEKHASMFTVNNVAVISSDTSRSQEANLKECFDKLRNFLFECQREILEARRPPTEEEQKMLDKRLERAARWRLKNKRIESFNRKMKKIL